jgi:hypothetical protein
VGTIRAGMALEVRADRAASARELFPKVRHGLRVVVAAHAEVVGALRDFRRFHPGVAWPRVVKSFSCGLVYSIREYAYKTNRGA